MTTVSTAGEINIAPMGPRVEPAMARLLLKPFRTSRTYRNLCAHPEGVFHVTDDVLLLAQAAIGAVAPLPPLIPAARVHGHVLRDCCRYYEFRADLIDDREERCQIDAIVLNSGRVRDFFGFNRAKHAVVEAAILATRTDFLPLEEIEAEFRKFNILVDKTGGDHERQALALLRDHVARVRERRADRGALER
ncbi:MAG TPA: DUF447 domain-containing protein [Gemmataceae bacterium]|nr:DUF447 domain-containing protein [Gemmataceae bacterium]